MTEHRGGSRVGSGRKKRVKNFSDTVRKNYEDADKYFSRYLNGEDIKPKKITTEMVTTGFIHGLIWERGNRSWMRAKIQDSVRISAQKVRQEALVVKESHATIEKRDIGPSIGLPSLKEKPKEKDFFTPVERVN